MAEIIQVGTPQISNGVAHDDTTSPSYTQVTYTATTANTWEKLSAYMDLGVGRWLIVANIVTAGATILPTGFGASPSTDSAPTVSTDTFYQYPSSNHFVAAFIYEQSVAGEVALWAMQSQSSELEVIPIAIQIG